MNYSRCTHDRQGDVPSSAAGVSGAVRVSVDYMEGKKDCYWWERQFTITKTENISSSV